MRRWSLTLALCIAFAIGTNARCHSCGATESVALGTTHCHVAADCDGEDAPCSRTHQVKASESTRVVFDLSKIWCHVAQPALLLHALTPIEGRLAAASLSPDVPPKFTNPVLRC